MTREQAKQIVYERFKQSLKPDKSGKGYICPVCKKSGTGKNGTGITENPKSPNHFTCWTGCFTNADAIFITAQQLGIQFTGDKKNNFEVMKEVFSQYGIDITAIQGSECPQSNVNGQGGIITTPETSTPQNKPKANYTTYVKTDNQTSKDKQYGAETDTTPIQDSEYPQSNVNGQGNINTTLRANLQQNEPKVDYTAYIKMASQKFKDSAAEIYINNRGISSEIAERFLLGYSESEYFPDKQNHPALIIPVGTGFYIKRNIENGERFSNVKGGASNLFNNKPLTNQQNTPVFITESAIDAMSVIEVGGEAVGLNSTSNTDLLIRLIDDLENLPPLILCLDTDDAGDKATEKLVKAFKERNLRFMDGRFIIENCNTYGMDKKTNLKDLNAALMENRNIFIDSIDKAKRQALNILPAELEEYEKQNVAGCFAEFKNKIKSSNDIHIPTGFENLDNVFDGGLYSGLYFIGAVSSLGKTTFCLQLADQIARQKQDVLVFSLEMAKNELIAKSISRLTFMNALNQNIKTKNAKTIRGITDGHRWVNYSGTELDLINESMEEYETQIAPHIWIFEGIGDVGVNEVREKVNRHISLKGRKPLVLIDYVQILSPFDFRATDKQNTDKAVLELKRISRDFDISVLCISSLNRESYTEPISMKAFKESGAIEYGSDVLLGLQYNGMDYDESENDKSRLKRIRTIIKDYEQNAARGGGIDIQLKVLKNRNGKKGNSINFVFYPMFNYFTEFKSDFSDINDFQEIEETTPFEINPNNVM